MRIKYKNVIYEFPFCEYELIHAVTLANREHVLPLVDGKELNRGYSNLANVYYFKFFPSYEYMYIKRTHVAALILNLEYGVLLEKVRMIMNITHGDPVQFNVEYQNAVVKQLMGSSIIDCDSDEFEVKRTSVPYFDTTFHMRFFTDIYKGFKYFFSLDKAWYLHLLDNNGCRLERPELLDVPAYEKEDLNESACK